MEKRLLSKLLFFKKDFMYLRERMKESSCEWGERQRESQGESQADSMLTPEPDSGLESMTPRPWPEWKS